uniref:oleosin L-like n=1 Tax=Erigeron canadensis TaxID=72917 RepID=UPI001CB9234B|nr:oleosin L-like [Erigeron canadensis]
MANIQQYNRHSHHHHNQPKVSHHVAKATTAVTLGGSLIVLSGFTMAATVMGLVMLTPLLVIFSPVLVPAVLTVFMLVSGFMVSGWLGATSMYVFYWLYRYVSGKHPIGADRLDWVRERIAGAAMDVKHKAMDIGINSTDVKEGGSHNNY